MSRWYDRNGNPIAWDEIGSIEWGARDPHRLKTDVNGYVVSTVFLSRDHNYGDGPPLIFESMVFGDGYWDQYCDRYATAEEAAAGHERIVEAIAAFDESDVS